MKRTLILMIIMAATIFTGCTKNEEEEVAEKTIQTVKAEEVCKSTLFETCSTNGNIRVAKSVEVYPVITGRVVSSPVKMGEKVNKGDVLAVIDPSITGSNYSLHQIKAPIDGNLISIPVQTGSIVSLENKIAVVGDLSQLQIIAYVPERFYSYLKPGLKADLGVEAYENEIFQATLKEVAPVIDEDSRTTEIILELDKADSKICAGMFADITLYLKSYENVISVPVSCVSNRGDESFVYTVENGHAKLKKLQTGITLNGRTQVVSGINEGDLIITEGFETLTDDEEINVLKAAN